MVRGHRGKVTAMDCVSDLPASGNKRKTILIFSCPISTFCTSVLIISRLRCQFASARTGPMVAASSHSSKSKTWYA